MNIVNGTQFLAQAIKSLIGADTRGGVVYIRCFPIETINRLCVGESFVSTLSPWKVYGIGNINDGHLITADRAVEIREDKRDAVLFLIDESCAGAGMDGIYSAGRELTEKEIFTKSIDKCKDELPYDIRSLAEYAIKQAEKINRKNTISYWQKLNFYSDLCKEATADNLGKLIVYLGLWPIYIATSDKLTREDIDNSSSLVEKLFLVSGANNNPSLRVESLLLDKADAKQGISLESFIRNNLNLPWKKAILKLKDEPDLWLNKIKPKIFDTQNIQRIEISPWQKNKNSAPYQWSGLRLDDSDEENLMLVATLNLNPQSPQERAKIEVRWKSFPEDLPAGCIEYKVEVVSGDDILAERDVSHLKKGYQSCQFSGENFEDLEEEDRFNAKIIIRVNSSEGGNDSPLEVETEDFRLEFGQPQAKIRSGVGKKVRALVDEACKVQDLDSFLSCCDISYAIDKSNCVIFRRDKVTARVFYPPLFKEVDDIWRREGGKVGRWSIQVQSDGTKVGSPQFIPFESNMCEEQKIWDRLADASRLLCGLILAKENTSGLVGFIHSGSNSRVEEYINAWSKALETGLPILALANTIEVQTLSGKTIGLIVPPSHPLRLAWHCAYDVLVRYAAYESKAKPSKLVEALAALDGSNFPYLLPGLNRGESFVFGDILGFYGVLMVNDRDREPKVAIAQMAKAFSGGVEEVPPSIGDTVATVLSKEVSKYIGLHEEYHNYHIHALRPGDAMTVTKALGYARRLATSSSDEDSEEARQFGYTLELYPSQEQIGKVGSFLTDNSQKRRAGAANSNSEKDSWLSESYHTPWRSSLPKLRWAKRERQEPSNPAHLSISFDAFDVKVTHIARDRLSKSYLQAYGLICDLTREFLLADESHTRPIWRTYVNNLDVTGEKHPESPKYTQRICDLHRFILNKVALNLGSTGDEIPVLEAEILPHKEKSLQNLHELSDWVVSVDKNAGIEYFDSPKFFKEIYESYIIDCVPERQQMGQAQLVTSTKRIEEVENLLRGAIMKMRLAPNPEVSSFILANLKSLSGRLAMRLANKGNEASELVALALVQYNCSTDNNKDSQWFSLTDGFFIPLDDVQDVISEPELKEDTNNFRADLVYVNLPKRGSIQFHFVEVKYRSDKNQLRQQELLEKIVEQNQSSRQLWTKKYFDSKNISDVEMNVNRSSLISILRFYADKAKRHFLSDEAYDRFNREVHKILSSKNYQFDYDHPTRGYILCPELSDEKLVTIVEEPTTEIFAFCLPRRKFNIIGDDDDTLEEDKENVQPAKNEESKPELPVSDALEAVINLGHEHNKPEKFAQWRVSVRGNPHLLIAGLPGMGKTTALINICQQLMNCNISPVIFSYHQDIDEKISGYESNINWIDFNGLGFNPMRVVNSSAQGYLDNAGMLRDIFASIFPDLGEIQLNLLRSSLKDSYKNADVEWGASEVNINKLQTPRFQDFYDILSKQEKPDKGLIARLSELNDYGFFASGGNVKSLLDVEQLSIVRIHQSQNEALQKAFSSFVLYNLYQEMFIRGVQDRITHAIVFDEAHRASKLKLLPTLAKECRKYGILLIVASQEAKDFNDSLFSAIGNFLLLRLNEADAKAIVNTIVRSDKKKDVIDRVKQLNNYQAFFMTGQKAQFCQLLSPS